MDIQRNYLVKILKHIYFYIFRLPILQAQVTPLLNFYFQYLKIQYFSSQKLQEVNLISLSLAPAQIHF